MIQWFPGHMHKARKEVAKVLPSIGLIIEVLDARLPYSSKNPMLGELGADKPRIKVLTKSDLADEKKTTQWLHYFKQEPGTEAIALSTTRPEEMRQLIGHCRSLADAQQAKHKTLNVLIMGIPNVGKSTLINVLTGRTIAKTGNEPAITKGQQRIKLDEGIMLFDTPGMMWPKVENRHSGYRLASTGAIKDTAIEHSDVAFFAVDFMLQHYPARLQERYEIGQLPSSELEFLELIGRQRGCLRGGGQVDLERISTLFLNELRQGLLGAITLETPDMILLEEQEVEKIKAAKQAKKDARKARAKAK